MSFSTGCRKCMKCGKMYLISLFDDGLCAECEKAEQEPTYNELSFPNTFDELVEQYGITDTDEVYTNGSKLIPAFRVKQWLAEQEPTDESNLEKICEELSAENDDLRDQLAMRDRFKQDPCDDAISRQAVDEIKELMTDINGDTVYAVRMSDIRQLPSVRPQEKTGKWIERKNVTCLENVRWKYECSECGYEIRSKYHYCPNCRARMVEPKALDDMEKYYKNKLEQIKEKILALNFDEYKTENEDKRCSNCKYWLLEKDDENRRCKFCFEMDEWVAESE